MINFLKKHFINIKNYNRFKNISIILLKKFKVLLFYYLCLYEDKLR